MPRGTRLLKYGAAGSTPGHASRCRCADCCPYSLLKHSKYVGVSWHKIAKQWLTQIQVDGRSIYLGYSPTEENAAKLHDAHAVKNSTGHWLNFQDDYPEYIPNHVRSSQYRGVSFIKKSGQWVARVGCRANTTTIGTFTDELDAARACDSHVLTNGLDRPLNFPTAPLPPSGAQSAVALWLEAHRNTAHIAPRPPTAAQHAVAQWKANYAAEKRAKRKKRKKRSCSSSSSSSSSAARVSDSESSASAQPKKKKKKT